MSSNELSEIDSDMESIEESFEYYEDVFFPHLLNQMSTSLKTGNFLNYADQPVAPSRAVGQFIGKANDSFHDVKGQTKWQFENLVESQEKLQPTTQNEIHLIKRNRLMSFRNLCERLIGASVIENDLHTDKSSRILQQMLKSYFQFIYKSSAELTKQFRYGQSEIAKLQTEKNDIINQLKAEHEWYRFVQVLKFWLKPEFGVKMETNKEIKHKVLNLVEKVYKRRLRLKNVISISGFTTQRRSFVSQVYKQNSENLIKRLLDDNWISTSDPNNLPQPPDLYLSNQYLRNGQSLEFTFFSRFIYKFTEESPGFDKWKIQNLDVKGREIEITIEGKDYILEPGYVRDLDEFVELFVIEKPSIYNQDWPKTTLMLRELNENELTHIMKVFLSTDKTTKLFAPTLPTSKDGLIIIKDWMPKLMNFLVEVDFDEVEETTSTVLMPFCKWNGCLSTLSTPQEQEIIKTIFAPPPKPTRTNSKPIRTSMFPEKMTKERVIENALPSLCNLHNILRNFVRNIQKSKITEFLDTNITELWKCVQNREVWKGGPANNGTLRVVAAGLGEHTAQRIAGEAKSMMVLTKNEDELCREEYLGDLALYQKYTAKLQDEIDVLKQKLDLERSVTGEVRKFYKFDETTLKDKARHIKYAFYLQDEYRLGEFQQINVDATIRTNMNDDSNFDTRSIASIGNISRKSSKTRKVFSREKFKVSPYLAHLPHQARKRVNKKLQVSHGSRNSTMMSNVITPRAPQRDDSAKTIDSTYSFNFDL